MINDLSLNSTWPWGGLTTKQRQRKSLEYGRKRTVVQSFDSVQGIAPAAVDVLMASCWIHQPGEITWAKVGANRFGWASSGDVTRLEVFARNELTEGSGGSLRCNKNNMKLVSVDLQLVSPLDLQDSDMDLGWFGLVAICCTWFLHWSVDQMSLRRFRSFFGDRPPEAGDSWLHSAEDGARSFSLRVHSVFERPDQGHRLDQRLL